MTESRSLPQTSRLGPAPGGAAARSLGVDLQKLRRLPAGEMGLRFAFGAAVSVVAGVVGLAAGPVAGGMFLAFPAILPASLTLVERKEGTDQAVAIVRGAVAGALGLLAFAVVVVALVGRLHPLVVLLAATAAWAVAGVAVFLAVSAAGRRVGAQRHLPEIPVATVIPAVEALREAGLTVAVAESCSGGVLAALLTQAPGAAGVMRGGVVVYSNASKRELLGIPDAMLRDPGAVSDVVACAMADAVRRRLGTEVGLAVTGLVGSGGEGKPPGLTYVAVASPRGSRCIELTENQGPQGDRGAAVREALRLCLDVAGEDRGGG